MLPANSEVLRVRVRRLWRDANGCWRAQLVYAGQVVDVDRTLGSWRVTPADDQSSWQDLLPVHASMLQEKVRRHERAERRALVTA